MSKSHKPGNLETKNEIVCAHKFARRYADILEKMRELAGRGRVVFQTEWELADAIGLKSKSLRKTFGRDFNDLVFLGLIAEVNNPEGICPHCGSELKSDHYYCLPDLRDVESDFGYQEVKSQRTKKLIKKLKEGVPESKAAKED